MAQDVSDSSAKSVRGNSWKSCLAGILGLLLCVSGNESAQATTGVGPYEVPKVLDSNADPNIVETYIVADEATVNIASPGSPAVMANGMAFKSCSDKLLSHCTAPGIPGPEFRLKVGDRVIVHFVNNLEKSGLDPEANVSGIHWHGIELNNASDGTEVTQPAVDPKGGKFDYDFIVSRPGIFWYHPHHHSSTNQVAKGLYGSIIVQDNKAYETTLIEQNVIPSAAQTKTLVLSDITVCNTPGTGTNPATFAGELPHVSGVQSWEINYQNHILTQSPLILCEEYPLDANGVYTPNLYRAGDVPNIQSPSLTGRMSEGFTVLTNGVTVDARGGDPSNPASPSPSVLTNALEVHADQGLRLQIVNPSPVRYMRLRLTTSSGSQVNLFRIGGEGGLLDRAVLEGGTVGMFDFKYEQGEILLPPASRADVVAKIPSIGTTSGTVADGSVLTLWTEDFERVAATYSWTPTVPVVHLKVNGSASTPYTIANGSQLLESLGSNAMVKVLNTAPDNLLAPSKGQAGSTNKDIELTFWANNGAFQASIDGVPMPRDFTGLGKDGLASGGNPFYLESARHAALSNVIELTVTNTTGAHHPFHLHGFSFQPKSLKPQAGTTGPAYTFSYHEFRDIMDVPANYTLTFRVSLDDRPTVKKSKGGGLGRWLFHCHILPHATFGMMSELHVH
jgi:FtsP/CotA-like multicopper oxidase with cupredoxin domain